MGVVIDLDQPGDDQLAEHRAPLAAVEIGADAEGGQAVMAELVDPFGPGAAQDVDQVAGAEALAGAQHGGERLARGLGAVPRLDRLAAIVALAAIARIGLAEMGEDRPPPAACGFADAEQRVELGAGDALDLVRRVALVDHPPAQCDVLHAIEHQGFGRRAVAAGAAGFLVIGFEARRQVEMRDEADVRLVDPHAEGDGRDQDQPLVGEEGVLVAVARFGGETAW